MQKMYSDSELIEGCLQNNRQYQELLYRKYADGMFTVACNYSRDDDEAADILQESFVKVFRKLKQHNPDNSLGGWIRRVVINTALEHYRKRQRYEEVLEESTYNIEEDSSNLNDIDSGEIVRLVNALPDKAQMVLKLFVLENFGHQEIASELGISVGTSKSQLNRAKVLLREMINVKNG